MYESLDSQALMTFQIFGEFFLFTQILATGDDSHFQNGHPFKSDSRCKVAGINKKSNVL